MSFSIQYNGITIGHGTPYTLDEPNGLFDIPIRTSSDDLTGGNGGNVWAQFYGMRPISFMGKIFDDDVIGFHAAIKALESAFSIVDDSLPLTITLPNGSSKVLYAKTLAMPVVIPKKDEYGVNSADYRVSLICEDPFYSDTVDNTYTTGLLQSGGVAIPAVIPAPFGGISGGNVVVNNTGDESGYAKFQIRGPVLNPVVRNSTLGIQFQIAKQIIAGEIVTIEKTTQGITVTSNINGNYYQYLNGNVFKFAAGNNNIVFSGAAYDSAALLTIIFRNKSKTPI